MIDIVLSAVAQLVSAFDGQPIDAASPDFRVDGKRHAAWPKSQGFFAFTGLADGRHELEVTAAGFLPGRATLTVPPALPLAEAVAVCVLDPAPAYQYPAWAAVLRGRVTAGGPSPSRPRRVTVAATYAGRDGGERRVTTASAEGGRTDGHYALALPGRRSGAVDVTVTFSADDLGDQVRHVRLEPGATAFLDVALT